MSALPWWKSKIVVGAGIAVLTSLAKSLGVAKEIPVDMISEQVTNAILNGGSVIGAAVAVGARITQKEAPVIVASKKRADEVIEASLPKDSTIEQQSPGKDDGLYQYIPDTAEVEVPTWMRR